MESNFTVQPNEVPNPQVDPSPHHPACLTHHPGHCFHQLHHHWVYPPFICAHAPIPRCACSQKANESLPAHNLPNGSPAQSNVTNTVSAKQETHNKESITSTSNASIGCQFPGVQSHCLFAQRHPVIHMHSPIWPHHYVMPCRAHRYCPPIPWCPMPPIPSMSSSCPANTAHAEADLNKVEAFSGHAEGEPTASYIGAEIWHREGEIQDNQDGATEDGYELEVEEEPIFVLTDEWMEFFAKSEARRQQKKKQQQKEAKKLRKAARSASKRHDGEVESSDFAAQAFADASSSALS